MALLNGIGNTCVCLIFIALFAAAPSSWAARQFPALPGETIAPDEILVHFKAGASPETILAQIAPAADIRLLQGLNIHHIKLPAGLQAAVIAFLAQHPLVDFVEPNRIRHVNLNPPSDTSYSAQWDLQTVQAFQAWSLFPNFYLSGATSAAGRIKVAVIDSGADCTHPDFINTGASSADAAFGGQISFADSRAFVATTIPSPACPWLDDHGHGTHVAGTVAAATNNGLGVASLGYPLELIVYKVVDHTGNASDADLAQAIMAGADAGAAVESISLGGPGYSQTLQTAVNYAWARNTLVVVAAGNSGDSTLQFPASANYAMAVAATDSGNNRASFSSTGNAVAIAAPGVSILSTAPSYPGVTLNIRNYATLSGTSMATPHVSALAGLVAMTTPKVAAAAIAQRIQRSADSTIANGGWNQYLGYGIIDAARALGGNLRVASQGGMVGQVVDAGALPVTGATVAAGGTSVVTSSTGLFRIPNLSPGTYALTVTSSSYPTVVTNVAITAGADDTVTVAMGVTRGTFTGSVTNAGVPLPGMVVEALAGGLIQGFAFTNGSGTYSLTVPAGTYDLVASGLSQPTITDAAQTVAANGTTQANFIIGKQAMIVGTVRNSGGTPVASAQVTVSGNGTTSTSVTDASGNYSSPALTPGTYSVFAAAAGQPNADIDGIVVTAVTNSVVNLQLVNVAPVPVSVTPSAASGFTQVFTLTLSDANGNADLLYSYFLVNSALDGNNACFIYYSRPANGLYLLSDNGGVASGPLTPGTAGTLQNSQCVLNGVGSSVAANGATQTLTIALTFNASFGGVKNLYLAAYDAEGLLGGWLTKGTYSIPGAVNLPPTADSISPNTGSGFTQTFQAAFSDPNGFADLAWAEVLVNNALTGANGCWVAYYRPANTLYLLNDAGSGTSGSGISGTPGKIQNGQCTLDLGQSSVTSSANGIVLNVALTFNASFVGLKTLFTLALDKEGLDSGWQNRGTWNIGTAGAPPAAVSVSPNSGTGASQSFTFSYSSASGGGSIINAYVLFTPSTTGTNACFALYDKAVNGIYLVNDNVSAFLGPVLAGANTTVQNGQCTINGAGTSVSIAGNALVVALNVNFNHSFAGTQNIFMYASDNAGLNSGWQNRGTWTVP